jgi:hypothetical protein
MLHYVPILDGKCVSLISCNLFCLKRKINTNACRSAESDGGITLKIGSAMPLLLLESVSSDEVGICVEWGMKPKLTNV